MKTVIYKEIDGYQIVFGFGVPVIDPTETVKAIRPLLAGSEEMKTIEAKRSLIIGARTKASEAFIAAAGEMRKGSRAKAEKLNIDINIHIEEAEGHEKALNPMVEALEIRRRQLMQDHAIYFEPRAGEVLVEDDEAATMSERLTALGEHELMTLQGVQVGDFRGMTFWQDVTGGGIWSKVKIDKIGDDPPLTGIPEANLTPEQRAEIGAQMNAERIAALSVADRATEKATVIDSLATQAAVKRSAWEIQGVTAKKALDDSRAWYEEQVGATEEKYA